jgi:hypothetical protein
MYLLSGGLPSSGRFAATFSRKREKGFRRRKLAFVPKMAAYASLSLLRFESSLL